MIGENTGFNFLPQRDQRRAVTASISSGPYRGQRWAFVVVVWACFLVFWSIPGVAHARATVEHAKVGLHAHTTRLVLSLNAPVQHTVFTLANPNRLVIDIQDARWDVSPTQLPDGFGLIERLRHNESANGTVRIVADLTDPAHVHKTFLLLPNESEPYRLVIDMKADAGREQTVQALASSKDAPVIGRTGQLTLPVQRPVKLGETIASASILPYPSKRPHIRTVVLDPGHGGKDPGAIGRLGTFEKTVTLAVARQVRRELQAKGPYKILLTRNSDTFVRLRDRVAFARNASADVFVSLHADSQTNRTTRGASVYTLSERASDAEAEALAAHENKADLISGLDLSSNPEPVTNILIDLAQRQTMNRSAELASLVVGELNGGAVRMLANSHRFAGFAVLKGPDIPAVLIEMGFLSNRTDEGLLRNASHRRKLALALANAIDSYFEDVEIASLR
ncbi:MAG: N-acetylmuramoyl-L-alanine amidase [Hyphomicrobiales bacterium]|nr:N-acetylmuramoyl-L-alanine amidase [Hyphomicrobiales bacterium]